MFFYVRLKRLMLFIALLVCVFYFLMFLTHFSHFLWHPYWEPLTVCPQRQRFNPLDANQTANAVPNLFLLYILPTVVESLTAEVSKRARKNNVLVSF